MFTEVRFHRYILWSRIYGVVTDKRCVHVYTIFSRIYGVVTDVEFVH